MNTVILDFEKRVSEIDLYFKLLKCVTEQDAVLVIPANKTRNKRTFEPELQKVMKANTFLLLYNLVESSIKQSLIFLYEQITVCGAKYKEVIDEIRKIWIKEKHKNFKDTATDTIYTTIHSIAEEVVEIEFDAGKNISGNIDSRKIKEFASQLGFSSSSHYSTNDGATLLLVKHQRNNLAHGNISFAECGRSYTYQDLSSIKRQIVTYLRRILNNIKRYIEQRLFMR